MHAIGSALVVTRGTCGGICAVSRVCDSMRAIAPGREGGEHWASRVRRRACGGTLAIACLR
eukprot:2061258-Pleurochrysis_carterae.AAC.1